MVSDLAARSSDLGRAADGWGVRPPHTFLGSFLAAMHSYAHSAILHRKRKTGTGDSTGTPNSPVGDVPDPGPRRTKGRTSADTHRHA
jgi:hypothetical protein